MRDACGFYYQEFSNFEKLELKGNPFKVSDNNVYDWLEYLELEGAEPLAYYDHTYFGQYPAITLNQYGKGTLLYEGSKFSDEIQEKVIIDAINRAKVTNQYAESTWPIIIKTSLNDKNKQIHFVYNYSSSTKDFTYKGQLGVELLSKEKIINSKILTLEPWGVKIIAEN